MAPRDNAVLARLDEASLAQLAPFMELVALRRGQWLYEAAERARADGEAFRVRADAELQERRRAEEPDHRRRLPWFSAGPTACLAGARGARAGDGARGAERDRRRRPPRQLGRGLHRLRHALPVHQLRQAPSRHRPRTYSLHNSISLI